MTPEERSAVIYDLVADGYSVERDGLTIDVNYARLHGSMVTMTLSASIGGNRLKLDNPFTFVNPPLGIADGDDVIVDPEAALAEMLFNVVVR